MSPSPNPFTVLAAASILAGVLGLVLLAAAAPWPLTIAVAALFTAVYASGSSRR